MLCLIFKNAVVYPIRLVNLAHLVSYVKSIEVEARTTLLNRSDSAHHVPHSGGNGLPVCPVPRPRV